MDLLISEIKKEKELKESHDRYPARFVFLQLHEQTEDYLFSLMNALDAQLIPISKYFNNDKWITWERLFEKINYEIFNSEKDLIFLGLSEFLRFSTSETLETCALNLIGLENNFINKGRILASSSAN